jgi:hypothetical protein
VGWHNQQLVLEIIMHPFNRTQLAAALTGTVLAFFAFSAQAASHSDAPLSKQDPQTNITDVYAFIGTKYDEASQKVLNVVVQVRPFSEPGDGVIYDRFADDARYSIHITNPSTGVTQLRYDFRFSSVNPLTTPGLKNPNTILSYGLGTAAGPIATVGDAQQNYTQTYTVTKVVGDESIVIGSGLLTPPPNVGLRTTPAYNDPSTGMAVSGAISFTNLDSYTQQTVYSLPSGEATFAGSRDDGFYCDIPGIFDLLDSRILDNDGDLSDGLGQDGNGVDGFKGFNVLSFAIQIPVSDLKSFPYTAPFADLANPLPALGAANGVGVYASVSRQAVRVLRQKGGPVSTGPWVQVNRMGNPFFNEGLVALKDKDNFNRSSPTTDAEKFATYAINSELAGLINFVFGTSFATSGRSDLQAVFIPEVLRVDITTPPVTLAGQTGFSRFGFAGGDTTTDSSGRVKSSGWPNGRRLGDDVADIALTAIASGPSYSTVTVVGDNVNANDQLYHQVFPYSGTPHAGTNNRKDPAP